MKRSKLVKIFLYIFIFLMVVSMESLAEKEAESSIIPDISLQIEEVKDEISDFKDLSEEVRWQNTKEAVFPESIDAIIEGSTRPVEVKWLSKENFNIDSPQPGLYVFTAQLEDDYIIKDTAILPKITLYLPPENPGAKISIEIINSLQLVEVGTLVNQGKLESFLFNNKDGKVHLKLMNDIDISNYKAYGGWVPIGNNTNPFRGDFDGVNHKIDGLYIDRPSGKFQGLFGKAFNSTITNLGVTNTNITAGEHVGAIIGSISGSKLENCYGSGTIIANTNSGGLVGYSSKSIFNNSYSRLDIVGINYTGNIGGIGGRFLNSTMENCYSAGNILGKGSVGGLSGSFSDSIMKNSYSIASVKGENRVGGLLGTASDSSVENSYSTGLIEGAKYVGGIAGNFTTTLKGDIKNCLALNSQIIGQGSVGSIVGSLDNKSIRSNNHAFDGIICSSKGQDFYDGNPISKSQIKDPNFWADTLKWNKDSIWEISDNKLPILENMPPGQQLGKIESHLAQQDISEAKVELDQNIFIYDESPKMPRITVILNNIILTENIDYQVFLDENSQSNGINSGEVSLTISGKNDFIGEITGIVFAIIKADQDPPAELTLINKTHNSILLDEINGGEYKNNKQNLWQDSSLFENLLPNTDYLFYARLKGDANHNPSPESLELPTKTLGLTLEGDLSITGRARFGEVLKVEDTNNLKSSPLIENLGEIFYQWNRDGQAIYGANYKDYSLVEEDIGKVISLAIKSSSCHNTLIYFPFGDNLIIKESNTSPQLDENMNLTDKEKLPFLFPNYQDDDNEKDSKDKDLKASISQLESNNRSNSLVASIEAITDANGLASIRISDEIIKTILEKSKAQFIEDKNLSINCKNSSNIKALNIVLDKNAIKKLIDWDIKNLEINGPVVKINLKETTIKEIYKQIHHDLVIDVKPKSIPKLKNAYEIQVTSLDNHKFQNLNLLEKNKIIISMSCTLNEGEFTNNLRALAMDKAGNIKPIVNSSLDLDNQSMIFPSNSSSIYAIDYADFSSKLMDIDGHWAKEAIDEMVKNELLMGISPHEFAPNNPLTRGMLMTILGRLSHEDIGRYKSTSFDDVDENQYYSPYIQWAYENNIVKENSLSQFFPDKEISREDVSMALFNFSKSMGHILPVSEAKSNFNDNNLIQDTYIESIEEMTKSGIVLGDDNNNFNPQSNITRAELSIMLHRYIKLAMTPL